MLKNTYNKSEAIAQSCLIELQVQAAVFVASLVQNCNTIEDKSCKFLIEEGKWKHIRPASVVCEKCKIKQCELYQDIHLATASRINIKEAVNNTTESNNVKGRQQNSDF